MIDRRAGRITLKALEQYDHNVSRRFIFFVFVLISRTLNKTATVRRTTTNNTRMSSLVDDYIARCQNGILAL